MLFGVLPHLNSSVSDRDLKFLPVTFTVLNDLYMLLLILLEVIEYLQFFIQSDESIERVLQLRVFPFQGDLEFSLLLLFEQGICKACHCDFLCN